MYLKEIQTYGFKSFADKINFEFTDGINGIVGPNGSGKSNVVDAVRWVLGEGSNKELRASDTTSVIFSGSKSRKPLNSAMVNIIFDNTDRHLPIDFNEVSIKRVLYRTGENEYYLNGEKCLKKEILELLTDSGAAKESFNIIGQGKIDEILSTKPIDRRVIFEEAAGVLKYKKRKEEAIRKLDRTNNNINRVNDIINELESNLEPLSKQASDAKKYLEYKDKLDDYDISLMVHDINNYSNELNSCKEKISEINDKITELNKNSASYDISILNSKNDLSKVELEFTKNTDKMLMFTKELEQADSDIKLFRERSKYVDKDKDKEKVNKLKEDILLNENNIKSIDGEISLLNKKIEVIDGNIINNNSKYNLLNEKVIAINTNINDNNRAITDINYKISSLEENINNGGNVPNSVKVLLNNPLFTGVRGTISSLISVDNEYALAVSTALGGASNYLVVDDRKLASRMVDYLKNKKLGRATFYPLDVIKGRNVDTDSLDKLKQANGYINTLDKVIKYDKKYENVIMNQLGNVILCDSINNANKISELINNRYKIVTLDGQVVNVGGSITGGESIKTNNVISLRYEVIEYKNKLNVLINQNQDLLSEVAEYNGKLKNYEEKILNLKLEKSTLENEIGIKKKAIDDAINVVNDLNKELKDIDNISGNNTKSAEDELVKKYYEIKENIDKLNQEIESNKITKKKINDDILEIEEMSKNSNMVTQKLEKELHEIELKESRIEVKIDTLLNSLNEEYNITYNEASLKYILDDDANKVRKEVNKLKDELKGFGVVNIGAIEEYERINTRYEFLTKQKEDLSKAEDTLLEIIGDMDSIMKEKFEKSFNEIRTEFKKVFKELFGGGNADIYMTDPSDLLNTGIELEATPPGKKLKSIQALSGGERTFTAISLLFAILNVRPVPFCLFDEVEAALDEANVDRFGDYLDRYRKKTQFIIITHKKRTMEYVDTLYGITMQESGVSKRVSVKLGEIKK